MESRGLISNRSRPELCGSPDQILVPSQSRKSASDSTWSPATSQVNPAEYKTATELSTQRETRARLEKAQQLPGIAADQKVFSCEHDSELCRLLVWTPGHRCQILRMTAVCLASQIVFVMATDRKIVYVVIIHFRESFLDLYLDATANLLEDELAWYRDVSRPLPVWNAEELGNACDMDGFFFYKKARTRDNR
mmetsp:Transcript_17524/g.44631  ORF Transcript_17524/g.44631 Transcript_17524/m.44631 type:complete len:193 (+) Transcript_17524:28-606(+)